MPETDIKYELALKVIDEYVGTTHDQFTGSMQGLITFCVKKSHDQKFKDHVESFVGKVLTESDVNSIVKGRWIL